MEKNKTIVHRLNWCSNKKRSSSSQRSKEQHSPRESESPFSFQLYWGVFMTHSDPHSVLPPHQLALCRTWYVASTTDEIDVLSIILQKWLIRACARPRVSVLYHSASDFYLQINICQSFCLITQKHTFVENIFKHTQIPAACSWNHLTSTQSNSWSAFIHRFSPQIGSNHRVKFMHVTDWGNKRKDKNQQTTYLWKILPAQVIVNWDFVQVQVTE